MKMILNRSYKVIISKRTALLAMMFLARSQSTQKFSTPTNSRLCTSSNKRNQAVIQDGRVDIQTKNAGYGGNGNKNAWKQNRNQAFNAGNGNDDSNQIVQHKPLEFVMQNILRNKCVSYKKRNMEELTTAVMLMAQIQPANGNVKTLPSYDAKAISELAKEAFKEREDRYLDNIVDLEEKLDIEGDDLLLHDAEMEVMNMILLSIPNEIYNSVDACTLAKDMWKRVECLNEGNYTKQKFDREMRFTNEFDQFVAEPGEALVSVYNHFAQLMNDLERNNMNFPTVIINTKFLNSLQPEWLKYVTQVRLAKRLTLDSFVILLLLSSAI
ncbi:hypothetical protein Tco_1570725 [Tanacetum coccineum]